MRAIIFGITWIIAGLLAVIIEKIRKKDKNDTQFPTYRLIFAGYVGFIMMVGLLIFPPTPATKEEERMYDK